MSTLTDRRRAPARDTRQPRATRVEIASPAARTGVEAFIEGIARRDNRRVRLDLVLDDGRPAVTCLDAFRADWLDLRSGDIVPVTVHP